MHFGNRPFSHCFFPLKEVHLNIQQSAASKQAGQVKTLADTIQIIDKGMDA